MKKNYPIQEKTARKGCLVVQMSDVSFLSGQPKCGVEILLYKYNKNKFFSFLQQGVYSSLKKLTSELTEPSSVLFLRAYFEK